MAKKNIPLVKPSGSNGQGNIQVPGGPAVLDLGDFDDIFGPMESDSPKDGPIGEFWKGMKESFSDRIKTKDVVRNFLRSAAPDGISNLMGFADEAVSATRDIKDSIERTNASDLQYIAKKAQALLPQLKDYAPDGLYNDISQGLENKIDEYDYTIQSQRDQTAIRRAAQNARDDNEVKSALDNIALTERLNHNRSEQAAQVRHQQTRAEAGLRDVLKTKRFDFMARSMGMANESIQRLVGYNEQVNYGFQRKGLELQFRSFLGIKELVRLQEANLELNALAYNAMIRNTGLTDVQKAHSKGLDQMGGQGQRRQGFVGRAVSTAANKTLSGFLGNYGNDAQGKISSSLSQKLGLAVMAMKMGDSGPSLWDNKYKLAGQFAGDHVGDLILNDLIPMLGREARPGLTNLSNKHAGGKHNQIGYYLDNMPAFLQEFVNNGQNQHGIKGKIRDLIAPYVPQFGLNDRLKDGTFQTIDQAAQFNQLTQRTIVDAIPGYLARMLQEIRMIRTGRDDIAREVFDVTSGKFTTEAKAHDNLQNKIVPKTAVRSASATINDALNTIDGAGMLSPAARKALGERALRDASTNRRFDPEAYLKTRGYAEGTTPEVAKELEQFFRGKFAMTDDGKMVDNADNHKLRQEFSQAFLDIRSISRDPIKEIERMIASGNTEPLRAIGIIITEEGHDKINYPRIWEILRSGVTDHNPYAPGGGGYDPNKDDMSGTVGHRDFVGPGWSGPEAAWAKNKVNRFRNKYAPEEQMARDKMAKHLKSMRGRFGSTAANLKDQMDQFPEQMQDIMDDPYWQKRGKATSRYMNKVGAHYSQQFSSAVEYGKDQFSNASIDALKGQGQGYAVAGMAKLTDLYSTFNPQMPLIKGIDFSLGDLIDVNTKKIIANPKDITGEVINRLGQTVVTAAEAAAGLMAPSGEIIVKAVEDTAQVVNEAINKHRPKSAGGSSEDAQDPDSEEALKDQDWSMGPGEDPVITARGFKFGEYFDGAGKILNSIKDIAGDVYDRSGNLVLSGKEFAEGLWSKRTGKRWRPTKGFARLLKLARGMGKYSSMTAGNLAWSATKFTAKAGLGIALKAFNFVMHNQNAYLPGEAIPVLTRRDLKNGEYYDDKGNVIDDFIKVYSPILNAQGEPVIAPELYKQLKNYDGTKHILAKNQSIIGKYLMRPFRTVRNAYWRGSKKYWKGLTKATVNVGGWLGKKTLGGFAKVGSGLFNRMFEQVEDPNVKAQIDATLATSDQQTGVLGEILEELRAQRPKEDRKGSWQDQAKRKSAKGDKDGKQSKGVDDEKGDGFLKRGLKGLAGLLGFGKGDEEDDDGFGLDDIADMAEIGDAAGNANERRKNRKGRKGGKKAGIFRRLGGKAVDAIAKTSLGGMALRGVAMAGTALAGLISGPVLIGAAAVTAVAGAGYLGYKRYDAIHGDFRELRFAQYGVDKPVKKGLVDAVTSMSMFSLGGDKIKVLKMEALLERYTDKKSDTPGFNINGAGGTDLLDIMGIDVDDENSVMVFARWMNSRFKPIYLAWQSGLNKLGKSDIKIDEIDDKLPNELKADFLELIKFPYTGDTPYLYDANPFSPDYPLPNNTDVIKQMFEDLTAKYNKDRAAKGAYDPVKSEADKAKAAGLDPKVAAGGAIAGVSTARALVEEANKVKDVQGNTLTSPGAVMATGGATILSGTVANLGARVGRTLTALQAIRMRAYGLQTLTLADVKAILALEAVYVKDLSVSDFSVDYNGDEAQLLKEAGQLLGKDTTVGSADRPKLYNWLTQRFAPAFRAYYATAKNVAPATDLANIESKLGAADKVSVGKAVLGAIDGNGNSIWDNPSLFDVSGALKDLKPMADADLKFLEDQAAKEVVSSPTQKSSDQLAGKNAADQGGSFADKAMGAIKDAWNSTKETVSTTWSKATDAAGDAYAGAKIAVGLGPDYGPGGAKGGVIQSAGETGTVLEGNGGQWESIPMPSSSGSARAALPTLSAVAKMTGVPVDWLLVIAGIESSFKYDIKAGTSSAVGWFQFIDGTWDAVYKKYGPKYGCPPDLGKTRAARKDPRINALMGAEYIRENYEGLKKALGRSNLTDVDVYMAHFLGLGGAIKFFRADPNAMAYKIFKDVYSANMALFFVNGKPGQPRTISELYQLFQAKIQKFWDTTGKGLRSGNSGVSEAAQTPGAEAPPKSEEELAKERLAADASSKEGVAAEATNADKAQPTVTSMAKDTGPMPGAPASGGGNSSGASSTTSTGTDSGGGSVDEQRNALLAQTQSQNTRRENEVRKGQQVASEVSDIQSKQLEAALQMRDLLSDIKGILAGQGSGGGSQAEQTGSASGGNSMTPNRIQSRPPVQRSSPLTLR